MFTCKRSITAVHINSLKRLCPGTIFADAGHAISLAEVPMPTTAVRVFKSVLVGTVRGKFLMLNTAWIHLNKPEKTVEYQWRQNASFVCGEVNNFPLTVPQRELPAG
jgi:hypothetical protein